MGVFKGFLSRAYKICTENHLQSEINFLINILAQNGHNRNTLTNIITEYFRNINKPKSNDQNNNKNTKNNYHGCESLALNLEKNLKRKKLKPYSH